jgi:hypothetical protein
MKCKSLDTYSCIRVLIDPIATLKMGFHQRICVPQRFTLVALTRRLSNREFRESLDRIYQGKRA